MEYKYETINISGYKVNKVTEDPKEVEAAIRVAISRATWYFRGRSKPVSSGDVTRHIIELDNLRERLADIELDIYGEVQ